MCNWTAATLLFVRGRFSRWGFSGTIQGWNFRWSNSCTDSLIVNEVWPFRWTNFCTGCLIFKALTEAGETIIEGSYSLQRNTFCHCVSRILSSWSGSTSGSCPLCVLARTRMAWTGLVANGVLFLDSGGAHLNSKCFVFVLPAPATPTSRHTNVRHSTKPHFKASSSSDFDSFSLASIAAYEYNINNSCSSDN